MSKCNKPNKNKYFNIIIFITNDKKYRGPNIVCLMIYSQARMIILITSCNFLNKTQLTICITIGHTE